MTSTQFSAAGWGLQLELPRATWQETHLQDKVYINNRYSEINMLKAGYSPVLFSPLGPERDGLQVTGG